MKDKHNHHKKAARTTEGSNLIVDRNAPAATDMISHFVEETVENIQHLFDGNGDSDNEHPNENHHPSKQK